MGAKFKCKKCKQKFNSSDGREVIQACVDSCDKPTCPLKHRSLDYIPKLKPTILLLENKEEAANDEVIEVFEEIPIGGLISYKEMRKRNGW